MSNNRLTTMGYFIKRLRDSGYVVDRLYNNYALTDPRSWTIIIDPDCASIFCTCYINDTMELIKNPDDSNVLVNYFEIYDGGQFIPGRYKIQTNSIEEFISYLVKFGINNKSITYPNASRDTHENVNM